MHMVYILLIVHSLNILCASLFKLDHVKTLFSNASSIILAFTMSNELTERLKSVRNEIGNKSKSLVCLATTRFSSSFLCLNALYDNRDAFMALCKHAQLKLGRDLVNLIEDDVFWKNVHELIEVIEPLCSWIKAAESSTFRLSYNFLHYVKITIEMLSKLQERDCIIGNQSPPPAESRLQNPRHSGYHIIFYITSRSLLRCSQNCKNEIA